MHLDMTKRPVPELFKWLKAEAGLSVFEVARTFNCGIGLLVTTPTSVSDAVLAAIEATGEPCWKLARCARERMRLSIWKMPNWPFHEKARPPVTNSGYLFPGRAVICTPLFGKRGNIRFVWSRPINQLTGWISPTSTGYQPVLCRALILIANPAMKQPWPMR